jgi:PAS domain S-box-containing protein
MKAAVITDDLKVSSTLSQALARRGHTVKVLAGLDDSLPACAEFAGDCATLVLIDTESLGRQPAAFIGRLRRALANRPVWISVVTPRTTPRRLRELAAAGADDFLTDPRDAWRLGARLTAAEQRLAGAGGIRWRASLGPAVEREARTVKAGNPRVAEGRPDERSAGRAQRSPWESDSRLRALLENLPDYVLIINRAGVIEYINRGTPECPAQQMTGKRVFDYLENEDCRAIEEVVRQAWDRGQPQATEFHVDSGRCWECRLIPMFEGHAVQGLLCIGTEVTERKSAEAALRESEATLRGLVGKMPDLVLVVDARSTIQFANREAPGATAAELVGNAGFGFLQPAYREAANRALRQVIEQGKVVHVEVLDVFDLWWSCQLSPIGTENGVTNAMIICSDITTRKLAEDSVKKEQDLLRQMLELSERDRELIAFEIHDGFSQQLAGAKMQFESAARLESVSPHEARQAFAEGMRLLQESIAESRRLVGGLRPPVLDEFGVLPAIEHLVAENARHGGPEVELVCPEEFPRLARPIENALFRIVQESLTNARRHSGADRVRVAVSFDASCARLSVRDWGIGFDPARVAGGRFGLTGICERVRLLEGHAVVDSAAGEGTRIDVELPLVPRISAESESPLGSRINPDG